MNKYSSRTGLFLIELVLSIFFFIVAATICIQLFVNTFFLSRETIETNQALLWSQNLAEPFLGNQGDYSILKKLYSDLECTSILSVTHDNTLLLCFDKDWNIVTQIQESYYLVFSTHYAKDSFSYQDIFIAKTPQHLSSVNALQDIVDLLCQEDYNIYQLSVKKFIP